MKIILISLNQAWEDQKSNREKVVSCLDSVKEQQADWVIFPEMTLTGFTMNARKYAEALECSPTIRFFAECAQKYQVYIAFGMILNGKSKATNNLIVVSPEGKIEASYAKIHPFSFAHENDFYEAGRELVTVSIQGITVGSSICYDLRFPEIFQALSKKAQVIVNIANWPEKRVEHWYALLKARAIENQVYFIGVNRTGKDGNGLEYRHSSEIIDMNGKLMEPVKLNEECDLYEIDPRQVGQYRKDFSVKQDRLPEFYKSVL